MKNTIRQYLKDYLKHKDKSERLILVFCMLLIICYLSSYASPNVILSTNVQGVTEKDYNLFLQNNDNIPVEQKTRVNCRLFTIDLEIRKPFLLVRKMHIERENLGGYMMSKQYMNSTENEFIGLGSYYANDGSYYHTIDGVDIYTEEMTDAKLYDFFGDYRIEISWVDLFNRSHKACYYLKDYH